METDSNIKMTDSLERLLSEREAEAMGGAVFAGAGRASLDGIRRLGRAAADAVRLLRREAANAKVDYAAG